MKKMKVVSLLVISLVYIWHNGNETDRHCLQCITLFFLHLTFILLAISSWVYFEPQAQLLIVVIQTECIRHS